MSEPQTVEFLRIYADPGVDGDSNVEMRTINITPTTFGGTSDSAGITNAIAAKSLSFLTEPADWVREQKPAPSINFWVLLKGKTETTVTGSVFGDPNVKSVQLEAGSLALFEDTTGKGHSTISISDEPVLWAKIAPVVDVFSLFGLIDRPLRSLSENGSRPEGKLI